MKAVLRFMEPNTELKKQLFRIYNEVNKEIYGFGVVELKISITDDMILFKTRHNRVPALQAIEEHYAQLKQSVDQALFAEFKRRLKKQLEEKADIHPLAMLRDYDSAHQTAVTVAILKD